MSIIDTFSKKIFGSKEVQSADLSKSANKTQNKDNSKVVITHYQSQDTRELESGNADLSMSSLSAVSKNDILGAKQKALNAKKAFQDAPSKTAEQKQKEMQLQKEFLNAYIDWAKTVIDDKNASKNDIDDVISNITGLKKYQSPQIKVLQETLNSYVPKLEAKLASKVDIATTYKIQPDDTLSKLAIRYGVSLDSLRAANPDVNERKLKVGQKINIPVAQRKEEHKTHTVQKGEYLSVLASKYGVSVKEIIEANPQIKNPNSVPIGTKLNIPEKKPVVINSNMPVDVSKKSEYKAAIADMMKTKGIKDKADIEKLSTLITEKSIEMKVDPVLIAGIVGQEVDFLYMSDNIWGRNGKGMTQLTYSTVIDLYRLKGENDNNVPPYYRGCKDKLAEIFKKYPTADELYDAICKKENYELNLEVGIAIFKGKMEIDYSTHPERTEQEHIEYSVRNYNGNTEKRKSGIEIRDEYRNKIIANYNAHKVA